MRPVKLFLLSLVIAVSAVAQSQPQYEQVLAPFDTMQFGGLAGSQWRAELWVRNDSDQAVNLFPETCYWIGGPEVCQTRIDVSARSTVIADVAHTSADRPGVFLYVPSGRVSDVSFNLRIRDLTHAADSYGTEIPVVRVTDFPRRRATLLNVPMQFGTRIHLRVYMPDLISSQFVVRIYADPGDILLRERTFSLLPQPTDPPSPLLFAPVIDLSAAFGGLIADRVRVVIERESGATGADSFWPMLTITNNRSNHVTVVTPR